MRETEKSFALERKIHRLLDDGWKPDIPPRAAPTSCSGYEIWRGPSTIDRKPLVVLLTLHSRNKKTGNMLQATIARADIEPHVAVAQGEDGSICGDCAHRGTNSGGAGTCYVNTAHGPLSAWRCWQNGGYPPLDWKNPLNTRPLKGRPLRIGAYGDPGAVPTHVWKKIYSVTQGTRTGYTHLWRIRPSLKPYVMASVDSLREAKQAWAKGWRTFRVTRTTDRKTKPEIWCPASPEGGNKTQCISCGLCDGTATRARSIAIQIHGGTGNAAKFDRLNLN